MIKIAEFFRVLLIPGTGNEERGTRERGTGNGGERGTGNGERGTGNGERGTGNGERGTGNGERGTANGERGTGNGERETGNGERGMGSECTAVIRIRIQNGGRKHRNRVKCSLLIKVNA